VKHWALRAAHGTSLAIIAEVCARAANTVFFVLLTRRLGEQEASTYALGFLYSSFLIYVALGGLDQLLNREVARHKEQGALILGNFMLARLVASLLCYGALVLWLGSSFGHGAAANRVVLVLCATMIPDSLTNLCQAYLIARERVVYITILGAITGGLKLGLGALILMLGGDALAAAAVVFATSVLAIILYLGLICLRFERPAFSFDRAFWSVQIRAALPLLLVGLMYTAEGSLDALLLSQWGGTLAVGVYNAATALLSALMIFPQAYRQVILPIMSGLYKTVQERAYDIYLQSGRILLIMALLVSTSVTLVADQALPLLYRNHFLTTIPVLQILIWSFVFICLSLPNGRLMLVAGRQSALVPMHVCSLLLNAALNLLCQPIIGPQGAALARVSSNALICILSIIYVQRNIYRWNVWSVIGGPLGASLCLAATVFSLRWLHVNWMLALPVGWLVFGIALFMLRAISAAELRRLLSLVRRGTTQVIARGSP
jgi:O-antigen/teichoic acid export membrane protein